MAIENLLFDVVTLNPMAAAGDIAQQFLSGSASNSGAVPASSGSSQANQQASDIGTLSNAVANAGIKIGTVPAEVAGQSLNIIGSDAATAATAVGNVPGAVLGDSLTNFGSGAANAGQGVGSGLSGVAHGLDELILPAAVGIALTFLVVEFL